MSRLLPTLTLALLACGVSLTAAEPVHDHSAHDHSSHNHGALTVLGETTLGNTRLIAGLAGDPYHGGVVQIAVRLADPAVTPTALRLWIGSENGRGSVKAKAVANPHQPGVYEAHAEAPHPLPSDAKLWLSWENSDGTTSKAALALPRHAH